MAMIYAHFERYAREKPDALAVIDADGIERTYRQEFQFLNALMACLSARCPKLKLQQPVGVACANRRLHMLLLFALEALGISTISFVQPIDAGLTETIPMCGLFIGEYPPHQAQAFFKLDQAFFEQVEAAIGHVTVAPTAWTSQSVVRLVTTSGSTGTAKVMPLSYRVQSVRVERRVWLYGMSADTRLLLAMVMTAPLLLNVQAVFSQGGAVIFFDPTRLSEHLARATDVLLLPIHLSELLKSLPADYQALTPLKIFCTGAELGAALRESAIARLGASIVCPYGTNEAGSCAVIDAHGVGTILPDVEVEVVDEDFKTVPYGIEGQIRIRSDEVVQGYLDAQLTREHFVDGWFLPGDLGIMPKKGQIRFTGRVHGVLNFGGVKYSPEVIEQLLSEFVKADDVAVCASTNAEGIDELQIGVVNSRLDDQTLAHGVLARMGQNFASIHLHRLESIPRTASGKVQRQVLLQYLKKRQAVAR